MIYPVHHHVVKTSANIATWVFGVVIIYQLLIVLGVVPITMAWGGRQDELTLGLRMASIAAMAILILFAMIIRWRAGLMESREISLVIKILAWVVTAYMALNTLGNLTSQSLGEKILLTPLTLILLVTCLLVAASKTAGE